MALASVVLAALLVTRGDLIPTVIMAGIGGVLALGHTELHLAAMAMTNVALHLQALSRTAPSCPAAAVVDTVLIMGLLTAMLMGLPKSIITLMVGMSPRVALICLLRVLMDPQ